METTGNRVSKSRKTGGDGAVADIRRDGRIGQPETTETITPKTRADYEEDYKHTHLGLIAEFVRDAAGM